MKKFIQSTKKIRFYGRFPEFFHEKMIRQSNKFLNILIQVKMKILLQEVSPFLS